MRGPTQRGISQGGDPASLELGAGWVEVVLARCQTMGWPHLDDTATPHRPRSGSLKIRPIRSVPSRVGGGTGGGWADSTKWKRGRGKCAGGNNIYTLAAVVGEGWAKGKSAIPVRGPSVAVFGTGENKTELARG